mgnify:CR=1 FL=1
MPLTVEIVTIEKTLLTETGVDEAIAPGIEGQLAVLPSHAAFMTILAPGELILKKGSEETPFAVTGGFFEVLNNKVIVLADAADQWQFVSSTMPPELGGAPFGITGEALTISGGAQW